jgi:hypothetical protein
MMLGSLGNLQSMSGHAAAAANCVAGRQILTAAVACLLPRHRFLHAARAEKARAVFPRPAAGPLRPVVRGQTIKYNSKQKLGRGFTLEELKV